MREYNDYVRITRGYLDRYQDFKATAAILAAEIRAQENLLAMVSPAPPVPRYGEDAGGAHSDLTPTEAAAAKRIDAREAIDGKKRDLERVELLLRKLELALGALTGEERRLIEGRYFERKTWKELSVELSLTEKWAARRGAKAVKHMAGILFRGKKTQIQQSLFVFAD